MEANKKTETDIPRSVIYLELDDEVTTIFERVRKARCKHVVLVAPARAQVLQSLVSLKILRFKSENAGKIVTVATKDNVGRTLALEAGLEVAESIRVQGKKVKVKKETGDLEEPKIPSGKNGKIKRRQLKIVSAIDSAREKLKQLSRDDIPLAKLNPVSGLRKIWNKMSGAAVVTEEIDSESHSSHLVVHKPNHRFLFGLVAAAVLLLFFIVYIAVPTATVYMTPRSDPLSKVVNVTLSRKVASSGPQVEGAHVIAAEIINFDFSKDLRIGATGQIFEGENARGVFTIYNRTPRDKFIVPSRFVNQDGIIFYTKKAITIPRAIGDTPGSIIAEVEACETDDLNCDCINEPEECQGNFVGERGNVGPSFFTMPAIPSLSPALYWAESEESMAGGVTKITKFISKNDLAQVEEAAVREITFLAKEEILDLLEQRNKIENRNLTLLKNNKSIEVEILSIDVPPDLEEKIQNDFVIAVSARVRAIVYEEDDLRALLFEQLETKVHPDKILTKVKFENAAYRTEELDLNAGQARLAVTIEGIEEYDLSEKTKAGKNLTNKIRSRILGKNTSEAEAYIRNLPEVNNAMISSWPFWALTIPDLPENVKFKVSN